MNPYRHEVKYYECDRMGVTHHSNYIRFMEEARVDWLDQLGFGFEKIEAENVFSPVISITCEYKRPTTFKDVIEIEVNISKMTEMKFDFSYVMRVDGKVVCNAQSTHCFIENNRPVALSKRLPEFYKAVSNQLQK
ncbi:MAG: acyl-CoA thioesterase [Bacteroidales bacterium]|nr:acyl-CoA thioesterase [Bacteroidales bacterium]